MKRIVFLLFSVLSLTSCATLFTGTSQTVQISSIPPGAKIQVDGIDRGRTPTAVRLKKKNDGQIVMLKLDGYETKYFNPQTTFNTVAVLNFFNILFWGIDVATGAIWNYDPKFYEIELEVKK